jgi:hypothetical protein
MTLPFSGKISMKQIRDEFLDDVFDNTLNEYGGGNTPFVKNSKTERKFSDYYGKAYTIIKNVGGASLINKREGNSYLLDDFFTEAEKQYQNDKIVYIDSYSFPFGRLPHNEQATTGVVRFDMAGFNPAGSVKIVNNNDIYGSSGVYREDTVTDRRITNGGHAIEIKNAQAAHVLTIENNGRIWGGGGAGSQGADGGFGRYDSTNGTGLLQSPGFYRLGLPGGNGAGWFNSTVGTQVPYGKGATNGRFAPVNSVYPLDPNSTTTNEGRGGYGGDGGYWGDPGSPGKLGVDGILGGSTKLGEVSIQYNIGAGGLGAVSGITSDGRGRPGGSTAVALIVDGNLIGQLMSAAGGNGGRPEDYQLVYGGWPQWAGAGSRHTGRIQIFRYPQDVSDFNAYILPSGTGPAGGTSSQTGGGGPAAASSFRGSSQTGPYGGAISTSGYAAPNLRIMADLISNNLPDNLSITDSSTTTPGGSSSYPGHGSNSPYFLQGGGGGGVGGSNGGNGLGGAGGGGAAGLGQNTVGNFRKFAYFRLPPSSTNRSITTKNKIAIHNVAYIDFSVIAATPSWGEPPDAGEELYLEISGDGSSWASLTTAISAPSQYWTRVSVEIPSWAITLSNNNQGVYIRIKQDPVTVYTGDVFAITEPCLFNNTTGQPSLLWDFSAASPTYDLNGVDIASKVPVMPNLNYWGGKGGDGWVLAAYYDGDDNLISTDFIRTPGTGTINGPSGVNRVDIYFNGAGGGGAAQLYGSPAGGGGQGGELNSIRYGAPAGLAVITAREETVTPPGAAGKAVFFNGTKPTNWTYTDNGDTKGTYN